MSEMSEELGTVLPAVEEGGLAEPAQLLYDLPYTPGGSQATTEYAFEGDGPVPAQEYGVLTARHEAMGQRIAAIRGGAIHATKPDYLSDDAEAYRAGVEEDIKWHTNGRR